MEHINKSICRLVQISCGGTALAYRKCNDEYVYIDIRKKDKILFSYFNIVKRNDQDKDDSKYEYATSSNCMTVRFEPKLVFELDDWFLTDKALQYVALFEQDLYVKRAKIVALNKLKTQFNSNETYTIENDNIYIDLSDFNGFNNFEQFKKKFTNDGNYFIVVHRPLTWEEIEKKKNYCFNIYIWCSNTNQMVYKIENQLMFDIESKLKVSLQHMEHFNVIKTFNSVTDKDEYNISFWHDLLKYNIDKNNKISIIDCTMNEQYDDAKFSPSSEYMFVQDYDEKYFFIAQIYKNKADIIGKWKLNDETTEIVADMWYNDDVYFLYTGNSILMLMNQRINKMKKDILSIYVTDIVVDTILNFVGFEFSGSWLICGDEKLVEHIKIGAYFDKNGKKYVVITKDCRSNDWVEIIVDLDEKYKVSVGVLSL
eukprot:101748_1